MNTDEHRWKANALFVFIGVHLWFQEVFFTRSRFPYLALVALVVVSLGCKGRVKGPAVAAPPRVAAAAEPISVPQTPVRLPPAQPVPPEAVPPEPQPKPPPEALPVTPAPPPKVAAPPRPPAAVVLRPAPAPEPEAPAAATPTLPPLRPVLTREQENDLRTRIDRSLTAAQKSLTQAGHADRQAAERVRAFLEQAQHARKQGDLIRARSLAERAEWLAADLVRTTK